MTCQQARIKLRPVSLQYRIGRVIAALGLLFILGATLTPISGAAAGATITSFSCLVCGPRGGVDVVLNVILFIPFAFGLRLAGMPARRVVALAVLLTIFVEGMQLRIPGRDTSLSDLLTNTAGGVLGATLAAHVRRLVLPQADAARKLAITWATVWLVILTATAWLLQPWAPDEPLRADWGTNVSDYAVFGGQMLHAAAGGFPFEPGVVPDSVGLTERLATGDVDLSFEAIVGQRRPFWTLIVSILDQRGVLGAIFESNDDIILQLPTNASRFALQRPALRLDAGRPAPAGELERVQAGSRDQRLWLTSSFGGEQRRWELGLSPSFGWSLLLPFEYGYGPEVHFLTALWISGWLLPLGYWTGHWRSTRRPRRRIFLVLGAIVIAGLAVIPWVTGFPPGHPSQWLAAAIGLAAGWAAASRVTYLAGRCASPSASESSSS